MPQTPRPPFRVPWIRQGRRGQGEAWPERREPSLTAVSPPSAVAPGLAAHIVEHIDERERQGSGDAVVRVTRLRSALGHLGEQPRQLSRRANRRLKRHVLGRRWSRFSRSVERGNVHRHSNLLIEQWLCHAPPAGVFLRASGASRRPLKLCEIARQICSRTRPGAAASEDEPAPLATCSANRVNLARPLAGFAGAGRAPIRLKSRPISPNQPALRTAPVIAMGNDFREGNLGASPSSFPARREP